MQDAGSRSLVVVAEIEEVSAGTNPVFQGIHVAPRDGDLGRVERQRLGVHERAARL